MNKYFRAFSFVNKSLVKVYKDWFLLMSKFVLYKPCIRIWIIHFMWIKFLEKTKKSQKHEILPTRYFIRSFAIISVQVSLWEWHLRLLRESEGWSNWTLVCNTEPLRTRKYIKWKKPEIILKVVSRIQISCSTRNP